MPPQIVSRMVGAGAGGPCMMTDHDHNSVSYGIDKRNRICCVDDNWMTFARENSAPELTPEFVIGKPLWDFFRGEETRDLTRMMFDKVRLTDESFVVPFRCDGPDILRPMVMLIQPGADRSIIVRTRTVHDQLEYHPIHRLPLTRRLGDLIKVCAWCCRIELMTKIWVDVEFALGDLSVLDAAGVPALSHGICPECFETVRSTVFF